MATINSPVFVDGVFTANNIQAGRVTVPVPTADPNGTTVRSIAVNGINLSGTGNLFVQVTPWTANPGSQSNAGVLGTAVSNITTNSFTIYLVRTTAVDTVVYWFAMRNP